MRILFVDLTDNHNPHLLYDKPTGGTLTSLTKVPEELVKLGHEVYVSSRYNKEETVNGVHYVIKDSTVPKWDVTVFNRNVLPFDFVSYCKNNGSKIVWWLHDIVDTRYLPDATFTMVDHIVALSNYCKDTYSDFYEIPKEKFTVISNGVDDKVFYSGKYEERNPHLYITASALIKGFSPVKLTYETLRKEDPDIDFRIYSSQKLHGFENTEVQQQFLNEMKNLRAHVYYPVSQSVLAQIMRKAWALLLPNNYPEICSNLLLQARACGLPIVSGNLGANPEFLDKGGLVTSNWQPHDIHSWIVEFARKTVSLQKDPVLHKKLSLEASENVPTWERIGRDWDLALQTLFK